MPEMTGWEIGRARRVTGTGGGIACEISPRMACLTHSTDLEPNEAEQESERHEL
jgi:hypothetical protein